MVSGWRRAFCTTIPKDQEIVADKQPNAATNLPSPKITSKFGFFSNPSTPRLQSSQYVSSTDLRCRTTLPTTLSAAPESPRSVQCIISRFFHLSNPSSPKSPSIFSLLKNSLRFSKNRCGICLQSVKTGGMAIFTAECSHSFHFPCIAAQVEKQGNLVCPVCSSEWKELPLLAPHKNQKTETGEDKKRESPVQDAKFKFDRNQYKPSDLKVYDDDEPLMSQTAGSRFHPIPESDETEDENGEENGTEEFQGFLVNPIPSPKKAANDSVTNFDVSLSPEATVVSVGRGYETYAIVLNVKAPPSPASLRRAPVDLVILIDVSGSTTGTKLQMMKRAVRLAISSLSSNDRLSIVAFSTTSKRLMPLRRMTTAGRRSAHRIVDALGSTGQGTSAGDAVRKAAKVLEDRREKNAVSTILLLAEGQDDRISPTLSNQNHSRFAQLNIPSAYSNAPTEDIFTKSLTSLLSVVVQDLRIQLGFVSGSAAADIAAVYSCTGRPSVLKPDSIRLGDIYVEEEREFLLELKVPTSATGSHHVLSVRSSYKDPSSQELTYRKEQALLVPRPHAVRSSSPNILRLRNLFVSTRAVAESRRLLEHNNDLSGAYQLLSSARALVMQSSSTSASAGEYLRCLESKLVELNWRRQQLIQQIQRPRSTGREAILYVDERGEPLTPTSAWRAAEKLAKVAIMRKALNKVGDLYGFENAGF